MSGRGRGRGNRGSSRSGNTSNTQSTPNRNTNYNKPQYDKSPKTHGLLEKIPDLKPIENIEELPAEGSTFTLQPPKAPGNISMKSLDCKTNYFEIEFDFPALYLYTVSISEIPKKGDKRSSAGPLSAARCRDVFLQALDNELKEYKFAFNGRDRAVALTRYQNDAINVVIDFAMRQYKMTFTYEKSVLTNCLKSGENFTESENLDDVVMGMTLMVRHFPSRVFKSLGQGFYGIDKPLDLGEGVELWHGFKMRITLGRERTFLNIDYSVAAFVKPGSIIDLIKDMFRNVQALSPKEMAILNAKLFHCKARRDFSDNDKTFTIGGLSRRSAAEETFQLDNKSITVENYFWQTYQRRLRYPHLQCIKVQGSNALLPLEVCKLAEGNAHPKELPRRVESFFIKNAAIKPSERFKRIAQIFSKIEQPLNDDFGVAIKKQLITPARVLPPPKLEAGLKQRGGRDVLDVQPGVIRFNREEFHTACEINRWTVVVTDKRLHSADVSNFVSSFMDTADKLGVKLANPLTVKGGFHFIDEQRQSHLFEKSLKDFVNENKLDYVMFVISDFCSQHAYIKAACDIDLCIRSKCVKSSTLQKVLRDRNHGINQVLLNILYGLNPKFGGENIAGAKTEFAARMLQKEPILIIGMDVNHGTARARPGMALSPSTVGIVGSRNKEATLYTAFGMAQKKPAKSSDREIIQAHILEPAIERIAKEFYKTTKQKPTRVLVFRDGVSEGQFNTVLDKEYRSIVNVFGKLGIRPAITFATVQKRHLTRVIPNIPEMGRKGPLENPPPGTVVDNVMNSPMVFDFYLASHETIQGTCKVPHYTVLKDENEFSADQIQNFAHYMCYLYAKCPRAVSIPTPTYYAHHMAKRSSEIGSCRWFDEPRARNPLRDVKQQENLMLEVYDKSIRPSDPQFMTTMNFL